MAIRLPQPTAEALADLRAIGRYLDRIADTAINDDTHAVARAHAIRMWSAIARVEALAELVEDLAQVAGALGRPDLHDRRN